MMAKRVAIRVTYTVEIEHDISDEVWARIEPGKDASEDTPEWKAWSEFCANLCDTVVKDAGCQQAAVLLLQRHVRGVRGEIAWAASAVLSENGTLWEVG